MASVLNKLNEISKRSSGYMSFDSLQKGKPYKVRGFGVYKSTAFNKKRDCVRVDLKSGFLILPECFDCMLPKLKKMSTDNMLIIYNGREGAKKRIKLEFQVREYDETEHDEDDEEDIEDGTNEEDVQSKKEEFFPKNKLKKKAPKLSDDEDDNDGENENMTPKKKTTN